ncbi:MAG: polysaccharide ABC transporter ATP-binding protein [Opitutaceae bacterium]
MPTAVIRTEGLSKRYRVKGPRNGYAYRTMREDLISLPGRLLRRNRLAEHVDDFWALRDVDLQISAGEVLGVIGRNGAGKSTLLKILSRVTSPTSGHAEIAGRVGSLLEVGTGFHPELTGRENIFLSGALLGMTRREIRAHFDEIVDFSGVERFLDTPCKQYSSGMYLRLAFAVAAFLRAEVLLIDEILAVGDTGFQRKCLGKMDEIARTGRTIVLISHDLAAIERLSTRCAVLHEGRLQFEGDPRSGIQTYLQLCEEEDARTVHIDAKRLESLQGDGVRVTEVRIGSDQDGISRIPRTGCGFNLDVSYETDDSYAGWSAGLTCIFRSLLGTEILRLSTQPISGFELGRLARAGTVQLRVPSLPFTAGRILLDIGLTRPGYEFVAMVPSVVSFTVNLHDFYESGVSIDQGKGLIVTTHQWRHERRD